MFLALIPTYYFLFVGYVWGYLIGLTLTAFVFYFHINKTFKNPSQISIEKPFLLQWNYAKFSLLINILNVLIKTSTSFFNYLIQEQFGIKTLGQLYLLHCIL